MPTKCSIMFTTYVIENQKGQHYIGQTENLEERLGMHNSLNPQTKKFHNTTFARGPWEIVFTKNFENRIEALAYEKFLKSGEGRKYLKTIELERARPSWRTGNDEVLGPSPSMPTTYKIAEKFLCHCGATKVALSRLRGLRDLNFRRNLFRHHT